MLQKPSSYAKPTRCTWDSAARPLIWHKPRLKACTKRSRLSHQTSALFKAVEACSQVSVHKATFTNRLQALQWNEIPSRLSNWAKIRAMWAASITSSKTSSLYSNETYQLTVKVFTQIRRLLCLSDWVLVCSSSQQRRVCVKCHLQTKPLLKN